MDSSLLDIVSVQEANFDPSQMLHGAGIYTYIWLIYGANVGRYSMHGAYGHSHCSFRCFFVVRLF